MFSQKAWYNCKQMKRNDFRWLPNFLSSLRIPLAVGLYIMASQQQWWPAIWFLCLALLTDFLDGLAAKKLHAESTLGGHIDRVADFSLALAGVLGLARGADLVTDGVIYLGLAVSLVIGYVKFLMNPDSLFYRVTAIVSLSLLFGTWTFIAWGLITQIIGWSWWFPPITAVLLFIGASLKKHRLKAWFGWLVDRK